MTASADTARVNLARGRAAQAERTAALAAEIDWLRSFRWPDHRIAARLGITVNAIQRRDERARKAQG